MSTSLADPEPGFCGIGGTKGHELQPGAVRRRKGRGRRGAQESQETWKCLRLAALRMSANPACVSWEIRRVVGCVALLDTSRMWDREAR